MNENLTKARSFYYEFFATPFLFYENDGKFNKWKEKLEYLRSSPIAQSDIENFDALEGFSFADFKEEQNAVLFNFSYTNVPLTASFYAEGRDDGRARLSVLNTLRKSNYRRDMELCKDSEDFIGFIFYMMSTLLTDEIGRSNFLSTELFVNVINNFVDEFGELLSQHGKSNFYTHLAKIMKNFFSLERSLLGIKAPLFEKSVAKEAMKQETYAELFDKAINKYNWDEEEK